MTLLCDTNVLLDVALHRKPYFDDSFLALSYCEDESVKALVSSSSLTDLFYIAHKTFHDNELTYQALEAVLEIFIPVSPAGADVELAVKSRHRDFEDRLIAIIAEREQCEYVITRNKKDLKGFSFEALTPAEFVKKML